MLIDFYTHWKVVFELVGAFAVILLMTQVFKLFEGVTEDELADLMDERRSEYPQVLVWKGRAR